MNPGDPGYAEAKARREARWNKGEKVAYIEKTYGETNRTQIKKGSADELWESATGARKNSGKNSGAFGRNVKKAVKFGINAVKKEAPLAKRSVNGIVGRLSDGQLGRIRREQSEPNPIIPFGGIGTGSPFGNTNINRGRGSGPFASGAFDIALGNSTEQPVKKRALKKHNKKSDSRNIHIHIHK